jgi:hypothetical protein
VEKLQPDAELVMAGSEHGIDHAATDFDDFSRFRRSAAASPSTLTGSSTKMLWSEYTLAPLMDRSWVRP